MYLELVFVQTSRRIHFKREFAWLPGEENVDLINSLRSVDRKSVPRGSFATLRDVLGLAKTRQPVIHWVFFEG